MMRYLLFSPLSTIDLTCDIFFPIHFVVLFRVVWTYGKPHMPTLERSNPLPLYYQLKEVLKQQIRSGHLAPHMAIPSEPELVSSYHVSRATVRQALSELVYEGLLYREHGKVTYVCEPRVQQTLSELSSLTEEIQRRGKRP